MQPVFVSLFALVCGMAFGSFVTVLINRLYSNKPGIIWGRSQCSSCHQILPASQLIPLLSYVKQHGESKCCQKRIPAQYPLIEITFGLTWLLFWHFSAQYGLTLQQFLITNGLLILFVYDLLYLTVDRRLTVPFLVILFAAALQNGTISTAITGALVGGFIFLLQYLVTRGKSIGEGDVDLGLIMGAILGFPHVFLAIVIAYLTGSLLLVPLWLLGLITKNTRIPLGAFLLPATILFVFAGPQIWHIYWNYPFFL
jgi:prepilin signal peptidase PulO-like enzyme (type II secretory pathway)